MCKVRCGSGWMGVVVAGSVLLGAMGLSRAASGAVIVSDDFDTSYHSIAGHAPHGVNLPGGTWSVSSGFYAWTNYYNISNALWTWTPGDDSGATTISISSGGAYSKPAQFSIQADFNFYGIGGGAGGEMLGFYEAPADPANAADPIVGFTGLVVNKVGTLTLVENGVRGASVAYPGGTFSPTSTGFYTLSYTVDTSTGGIADVAFAGSDYGFSSTAFTSDTTAYAGIAVKTTGRDTQGYADNFSVNTVPEPASVMGAGIGVMWCLARRRRGSAWLAV